MKIPKAISPIGNCNKKAQREKAGWYHFRDAGRVYKKTSLFKKESGIAQSHYLAPDGLLFALRQWKGGRSYSGTGPLLRRPELAMCVTQEQRGAASGAWPRGGFYPKPFKWRATWAVHTGPGSGHLSQASAGRCSFHKGRCSWWAGCTASDRHSACAQKSRKHSCPHQVGKKEHCPYFKESYWIYVGLIINAITTLNLPILIFL